MFDSCFSTITILEFYDVLIFNIKLITNLRNTCILSSGITANNPMVITYSISYRI